MEELDVEQLQKYINNLYFFLKEKLNFDRDVDVILLNDQENAQKVLGKTAYYVPRENEQDMDRICVYTFGRHPKDILRSISHEMKHHEQNCSGHLPVNLFAEEGYAQKNKKLRELEKDAYLHGNILFRDWEDQFKQDKKDQKEVSKLNESKYERIMNKLLGEASVFYSDQESTDFYYLDKNYQRYVQSFLNKDRNEQNGEPNNGLGENGIEVDAFDGTFQSVLNPRLKNFGFHLAQYDMGKIYKYVDYQQNMIIYDVLADPDSAYPLSVLYYQNKKLIEKRENIDFLISLERLKQLFNLDDGIAPKVRATGHFNI